MGAVEERLAEAGLVLPAAAAPLASYVPAVRCGRLVYTAGQIATRDGTVVTSGRLGAEVDIETGQECARICALNVLAQVKGAVGSLDTVQRVVRLTVFVASDPAFTAQHLVANGASDVMVLAFGDAGRHVRSAVGVAVLPFGSPVEVEALVDVGDDAAAAPSTA